MAYSFILDGNPQEREIALVRNETEDVTSAGSPVEGSDYFLPNERIQAFLETAREEAPADANDAEVRLWASAACLDVLATNQAYVLKKQETLAEKTDGPAVAKEIREHAARCRARAEKSLNRRREDAANAAAEAAPIAEPMGGNTPLVLTR